MAFDIKSSPTSALSLLSGLKVDPVALLGSRASVAPAALAEVGAPLSFINGASLVPDAGIDTWLQGQIQAGKNLAEGISVAGTNIAKGINDFTQQKREDALLTEKHKRDDLATAKEDERYQQEQADKKADREAEGITRDLTNKKLKVETDQLTGNGGYDYSQPTTGVATTFGYKDAEDNGLGAWGDVTNDENIKGVSLPIHVLKEHFGDPDKAHNALVEVTNPATGVTGQYPIIDKGPADWVEKRQGSTIDLTHAANMELGGDGKTAMTWRILSKPASQGPLSSLSIDSLGTKAEDLTKPLAPSLPASASTPPAPSSAPASEIPDHATIPLNGTAEAIKSPFVKMYAEDGAGNKTSNYIIFDKVARKQVGSGSDKSDDGPDQGEIEGYRKVPSGQSASGKTTYKYEKIGEDGKTALTPQQEIAKQRAVRQEQAAFYQTPPIKVLEGQAGPRQALPKFVSSYEDAKLHPKEAGIHDISMLDMYVKAESGGRVTEAQAELALKAVGIADSLDKTIKRLNGGDTLSQGQRDSMLRVLAENYNSGADLANQSVEAARQRLQAQGITDEAALPKPYVKALTSDHAIEEIKGLKEQYLQAEKSGADQKELDAIKEEATRLSKMIKSSKQMIINMDDIRNKLQGFGGGVQGITVTDDGAVE